MNAQSDASQSVPLSSEAGPTMRFVRVLPLKSRRRKLARPAACAMPSSDVTARSALSAPVRFEFHHPTARRIFVVGSFNDWNPSATPLANLGDGRWLRLLWLPPGQHEYLFVADGVWCFDPGAADYAPNVYATMNAVVEVLTPSETGKRGCHRRLLCRSRRNAVNGSKFPLQTPSQKAIAELRPDSSAARQDH